MENRKIIGAIPHPLSPHLNVERAHRVTCLRVLFVVVAAVVANNRRSGHGSCASVGVDLAYTFVCVFGSVWVPSG